MPRWSSHARSSAEIRSCSLPDGQEVDWIVDITTGEAKFVWFDGLQYQVGDLIDVSGETFAPPDLDPHVLSAVGLPSGTSDYGTTQQLFGDTYDVLTSHGIADEVALAATHFAFATWFQDSHRPAPGFIVTGPPAEAILLLQLLSLVVRRGVVLGEADSQTFRELVGLIHPTFLVDSRSFSSRSLRMLLASRVPRAYVGWKGVLRNCAAATAVYVDLDSIKGNIAPDFSLNVNLQPSRGPLSFFTNAEREKLIASFQPRLLDYRLRNWDKVRQSSFEFANMHSELRVLSQVLGACIVDAPEIQAGLKHVLEGREADLRAERSTNLDCVTIEALLYSCHEPGLGRLSVGKITDQVNVILEGRGGRLDFDPRAIGHVLRRLGFVSERKSSGFQIFLTPAVVRRIHDLADKYNVAAVESGLAHCAVCTEIFMPLPEGDKPASDEGQ